MPERGIMSAQSLAAISYHQAVPPGATGGEYVPRKGGVREGNGGKIEISINILNGEAFSVLLDPNAPVKQLKQKIDANCNLAPDDQQLVFAGKQLKDDKTMSDYGITKNCVIFCVRRTSAGGEETARSRKKYPSKKTKRYCKLCPC